MNLKISLDLFYSNNLVKVSYFHNLILKIFPMIFVFFTHQTHENTHSSCKKPMFFCDFHRLLGMLVVQQDKI